jgi:hypothetical protein
VAFPQPGGGNTSQGESAKEFASALQTFTDGYRSLQELTDDRKATAKAARTIVSTAKAVKRLGAIQVFRPRVARPMDPGIGEYRMSRLIDDFSFAHDPYFGRNRTFRVATAYKTKANKVRPVDPGETDGSKPGGSLDWLEKSKTSDVPC